MSKKRSISFVLTAFLFLPVVVFANDAADALLDGVSVAGNSAGFGSEEQSTFAFIGGLIKAVLGVLGIAFLLLLIYSGILYLLDQGTGDGVKKAKALLKAAIIGMIIIVAAYAIANFVIAALISVAG